MAQAEVPVTEGWGDDDAHEGSTVRRGMSFAVLSFSVNGVLGLVGAVITSRLYGVDVMGQYALVIAPWIMLIQLSTVAERVALVRELAGLPPRSPRVTGMLIPVIGFSTLLTTTVAIPVMAVTALIYRGPADQPGLVLPALLVVVAYILFDNLSGNLDGVFSAFRSGRDLFIGRLVQIGSMPVLAAAFAFESRSVWSLTVATILVMVISLVARLILVRTFLTWRVSREAVAQGLRDLPDLLRFGVKVVPGQLIAGFVDQTTTWVLGAVAPISVVGSWSRAFQLSQRMNEAGYRICEILYPTLVQRFRDGDEEGFARSLRATLRFSSILMFLLVAALGGAANGVLGIFGPGFQEAAGAFAILLAVFATGVQSMALMQAVIATGHPHQLTIMAAIRSVIALALLVPGAIHYGATGAALALLTAAIVEVVLQSYFVSRYAGRSALPPWRFVIVLAMATAAGFGVSRVLDVELGSFVGLVVALVLGAACYVTVIWVGALEGAERAMVLTRAKALLRRG